MMIGVSLQDKVRFEAPARLDAIRSLHFDVQQNQIDIGFARRVRIGHTLNGRRTGFDSNHVRITGRR